MQSSDDHMHQEDCTYGERSLDMPLTTSQSHGLHALYYLATAAVLATRPELCSWRRLGEYVTRAESYICPTNPSSSPSPDCKVVQKFIDTHQDSLGDPTSHPQPVTPAAMNTLRDNVLQLSTGLDWEAKAAGLQLGAAVALCILAIRFGLDAAAPLRLSIQAARKNLGTIDPRLAERLETLEAQTAPNPPPYALIEKAIDALEGTL